MDFYLNNNNVANRLVEEYKKYGALIVAYDFDDTIFDCHKKGRKYNCVMRLLRRCKKLGCKFIVSTCNGKEKFEAIRQYLKENKLPCDTINENLPDTNFDGRKIYCNILLDDRAGLPSAYRALYNAVKIIEKEKKVV